MAKLNKFAELGRSCSARAYRAVSSAAFLLLVCSSSSSAEQQFFDNAGKFNGSYACTVRNSAGIYYDKSLKDWRPSVLESGGSFIVDVAETGNSAENSLNEIATSYSIRIIDSEKKSATRCTEVENTPGGEPTLIVEHNISKNGRVGCQASLTDYRFNFSTLRFIIPYTGLYFLDGIDAEGDTPSITAGTCEKMD